MVAFRMEATPQVIDNKKNNFQEFCQQTSLHGWQHIQRVNTIKGRIVWFSIVLASLAVASLFLATAAKDFVLRSVVTTIETTTGPLQVGLQKMKKMNTVGKRESLLSILLKMKGIFSSQKK